MIFWWRENNLSFEQECQFLKSNGFGIELWPSIKGQDECRYERRNWPRLLTATEGMLVSMRSAQSRNGGLSLDKWAEQIECAKMLKANIVTDLRSLGAADEADNLDYAEQVVDLAEQYDVKLCLETGRLDEVKRVGEKFDSIWYCLDTGYAHLDNENSFKEYVDQLAPKVAHLHLADNYGQTDDHEPPGLKGGIAREDWQYLLEALRKCDKDVIGALEMNPCMPGVMLRQATEFLFDELKWPDKPQKQPDQAFTTYNPA
jgi:sugar phosphate isomerase/epimerase